MFKNVSFFYPAIVNMVVVAGSVSANSMFMGHDLSVAGFYPGVKRSDLYTVLYG